MAILAFMALIALAIGCIWYLVVCVQAIKILKNKHRELWIEYGSFEMFSNNNPASSSKFLKFILGSHYKTTGDRELISKFDRCKSLIVVNTILLVGQVIFMVLM